jgi:hypothetical protein
MRGEVKKKTYLIGIAGILILTQPIVAQTWLPTQRLTWTSGQSGYAAIATGSGNNIHVVWQDYSTGNDEIYCKNSTNGGITWGMKRLTWNSGVSVQPAIAVDPSNNIHVVWYDWSPGNYEIYYRRSTNSGGTWGSAKRLSWNSGMSSDPSLATDSSNNIHLVWEDSTPGNVEIFYRKGGQ